MCHNIKLKNVFILMSFSENIYLDYVSTAFKKTSVAATDLEKYHDKF